MKRLLGLRDGLDPVVERPKELDPVESALFELCNELLVIPPSKWSNEDRAMFGPYRLTHGEAVVSMRLNHQQSIYGFTMIWHLSVDGQEYRAQKADGAYDDAGEDKLFRAFAMVGNPIKDYWEQRIFTEEAPHRIDEVNRQKDALRAQQNAEIQRIRNAMRKIR